MAPHRPEAAAMHISVSMGQEQASQEDVRYWFDQSVAAQMDWEDAYNRYFTSLEPKWGGSNGELYDFAIECAETKRFDTNIPTWCCAIFRHISDEVEHADWIEEEDLDILNGVFRGYARADDPGWRNGRDYYREVMTAWHYYAGDAKGVEGFVATRDWNLAALARMHVDGKEMAMWGHGQYQLHKPFPVVEQAMELFEQGEYAEARPLFEEAIAELTSHRWEPGKSWDRPSAPALLSRHMVADIDFRLAYETGDWVPLAFDPDLFGWHLRMGKPPIEATGNAVALEVGDDNPALLTLRSPVGRRWELTGVIEFDERVTGPTYTAFVLSSVRNGFHKGNFHRIAFYENGDMVEQNSYQMKSRWIGYPIREHLPIRIQVWDDYVRVLVDEQLVLLGVFSNSWAFRPGEQFSLGATAPKKRKSATVVFRDMKIRRLDEVPDAIRGAYPDEEF